MEGQDLSAESEIWTELAVTEMRLELMSKLMKIKVGFADIEEFNLGLKGNLKNPQNPKIKELQESKVVRASMEVKMRDEQIEKRKKMKSREDARRRLGKMLGKNSNKYRSRIKRLRKEALEKKAEYRKWYDKKLEHLRFKYREDKDEKLDKIPSELEEYASLSIFDREKFNKIKLLENEATCVGNVKLSDEVKKVL